ncbi:hypothetical protein [Gulosibacter molinativorax]|uniref:Adhesin domain-containing protein n=1 Tax=Gulosibacter molinativorax TaxID=256821 RepID=A0ABT7CAF7_9MICO|nr:hypothetical protein [Gulosibacter molinativorax]MDJ1372168.1 hypothetical protein [Gulosibacter molinativorax]QUY60961.1 Hypotetical protein [Gulosibacter molinativorax]
MNTTNDHDTLPVQPATDAGSAPPPTSPPSNRAPEGPKSAPGARRYSWVGIVATVIGGILLIGLLVSTIFTQVWSGSVKPFSEEFSAPAVSNVRVDADYGQYTIQFSDSVTEAQLAVEGNWAGGNSPVSLETSGDELVVESSVRVPWYMRDPQVRGTLTLPSSLEGEVDLTAHVGVGSLKIDGDTNSIDGNVSTGELIVNGRFETGEFRGDVGQVVLNGDGGSAMLTSGAGQIEAYGSYDSIVMSSDVGTLSFAGNVKDSAEFTVDAGGGTIRYEEIMPANTVVNVSFGDVEFQLPGEPFQLNAPNDVRDSAERAGYDTSGGAGAPQVSVSVEIGDVSFAPNTGN